MLITHQTIRMGTYIIMYIMYVMYVPIMYYVYIIILSNVATSILTNKNTL